MRVTNHELMSSLYHHYSICSPLKLSHYGSNVQQARQLKVGAYSKVQKCFFFTNTAKRHQDQYRVLFDLDSKVSSMVLFLHGTQF